MVKSKNQISHLIIIGFNELYCMEGGIIVIIDRETSNYFI